MDYIFDLRECQDKINMKSDNMIIFNVLLKSNFN